MNRRALLLGGLGVGFALGVSLAIVNSTHAQIGQTGNYRDDDRFPKDLLPKVKFFERTDLFGSSSYRILPTKNSRIGRILEQEELPLEFFKARLRDCNSQSDYIEAATRYLEAEGFTVIKKVATKKAAEE
jgi:hypothetical protein